MRTGLPVWQARFAANYCLFSSQSIEQIGQPALLIWREGLQCADKTGVQGRLLRGKKVVEGDVQTMADVGEEFDGWIFVSELHVPEIALGDPGEIRKLVCGEIALHAQLGDPLSNVHNNPSLFSIL